MKLVLYGYIAKEKPVFYAIFYFKSEDMHLLVYSSDSAPNELEEKSVCDWFDNISTEIMEEGFLGSLGAVLKELSVIAQDIK